MRYGHLSTTTEYLLHGEDSTGLLIAMLRSHDICNFVAVAITPFVHCCTKYIMNFALHKACFGAD